MGLPYSLRSNTVECVPSLARSGSGNAVKYLRLLSGLGMGPGRSWKGERRSVSRWCAEYGDSACKPVFAAIPDILGPGILASGLVAALVLFSVVCSSAAEADHEGCVASEAARVAVTGPGLEGFFRGADGTRYFATDLYRPGKSASAPGGGNEAPASGVPAEAFQAIALGPENRWGLVPALVVVRQNGAEQLLQERELALGAYVFQPEWVTGACADALRRAERRAREDRLGLWSANVRGDFPVFATGAPDRLSAMLGSYVIAQGHVVSLGKTERTRYLNFGSYWKTDFTATIAASQEASFDEALGGSGWRIADLAGKLVELRGVVQDRDGPFMQLRNPEQIVVLEHPVFE